VLILPQLATKYWNDRAHTQHIELHVKCNLSFFEGQITINYGLKVCA